MVSETITIYDGPDACRCCLGWKRVANSDSGESWKYWAELKAPANLAVTIGLARPVVCPRCKGSGREPESPTNQGDAPQAERITVDPDAIRRRLERRQVIEQLLDLTEAEQQRCERAEAERDRVIAAAEEGMAALNAALAEAFERIQSDEADLAAWWQIVSDLRLLGCLDCSNAACDRARDALGTAHPGAALLAELAAARALAAAIREHRGGLIPPEQLDDALAAYDATASEATT